MWSVRGRSVVELHAGNDAMMFTERVKRAEGK